MNRREAREFMMITCYQMDLVGGFDVDRHDEFFKDRNFGDQNNYVEIVFSILCNKIDEIDERIQAHSETWDIKRIPKTDLAALRIGALELLYMDEVPDSVAINEAIDMAKKYGCEKSGSFVNGVLAKIVSK